MNRKILQSKIHRATVTHADVDYEGSLTIPPELMALADVHEYEAISVWNVTRGTRFETYAITGEPDSTFICVNGAAAHLAKPGDLIIIACFGYCSEAEAGSIQPRLIFVDEHNRAKPIDSEIAGPKRRVGR